MSTTVTFLVLLFVLVLFVAAWCWLFWCDGRAQLLDVDEHASRRRP